MKTKEAIEKEFFNDFGNTGAWEELDNIALYISKIRQDDIDGLVEWAEKERDGYMLGAMNGKIKKMIPYDAAFINIIAHLHELKKHI